MLKTTSVTNILKIVTYLGGSIVNFCDSYCGK